MHGALLIWVLCTGIGKSSIKASIALQRLLHYMRILLKDPSAWDACTLPLMYSQISSYSMNLLHGLHVLLAVQQAMTVLRSGQVILDKTF